VEGARPLAPVRAAAAQTGLGNEPAAGGGERQLAPGPGADAPRDVVGAEADYRRGGGLG